MPIHVFYQSGATAAKLDLELGKLAALVQGLGARHEGLEQLARASRERASAGEAHRVALLASDAQTLLARARRAQAALRQAPERPLALADGISYGLGSTQGRPVALQSGLRQALLTKPQPGGQAMDEASLRACLLELDALTREHLSQLQAWGLDVQLAWSEDVGALWVEQASGRLTPDEHTRWLDALALALGQAQRLSPSAALVVHASQEARHALLERSPQVTPTLKLHERAWMVGGPEAAIQAVARRSAQTNLPTQAVGLALHHVMLSGAASRLEATLGQDARGQRLLSAMGLQTPRALDASLSALLGEGHETFILLGPDADLSHMLSRAARAQGRAVTICALSRPDEPAAQTRAQAAASLFAAGHALRLEEAAHPIAVTERQAGVGACLEAAPTQQAKIDDKDEPAMTQPNETPSQPMIAVDPAWLAAFEQNQRQLVEAHAQFQEALMRGHEAFVRAMERAQEQLVQALSSAQASGAQAPRPSGAATPGPAVRPAVIEQAQAATPAPKPRTPSPSPSPSLSPSLSPSHAPALTQAPKPKPQALAPSRAASAVGSADLAQTLLEVVAQKTGYPSQMLSLDMELEGDLGIDSIKRVEIFSALEAALPWLPALDAAHVAQLSSLREVLALMDDAPREAQTREAQMATQATPERPSASASAVGSADLAQTLLEVVAQKTGYPSQMLSLDMELEGDLGIDSIKRVEIFSALEAALPWLPALDAAHVAQLSSLREVLQELSRAMRGPAGEAAPAFFPGRW